MVKKYWIFIEHLPATSVLAVICWIQDQALSSILTIFFFGWLIDADHVFDYLSWAIKNKQPFVIKDFVKGRQFTESLKVYLPLHSWEIAGALFLLWLFQSTPQPLYFWSALALATHLVQDQLTHRPATLGYFIVFRLLTAFSQKSFCNK